MGITEWAVIIAHRQPHEPRLMMRPDGNGGVGFTTCVPMLAGRLARAKESGGRKEKMLARRSKGRSFHMMEMVKEFLRGTYIRYTSGGDIAIIEGSLNYWA